MNFGGLIPQMRPYAKALVTLADQYGLSPRVTSTRRTYSQQKRLYDMFLAGKSLYPVAPPGTSAHEFGFAMDMVVSPYREILELGKVWVDWGGFWHPSDEIHFEYPGFPHAEAAANPAPGHAASLAKSFLTNIVPGFLLPWWADLLLPTSRPKAPPDYGSIVQ